MERCHTDDGIQQRLESPAVTLTATVTGMRVHKHHQSFIFKLFKNNYYCITSLTFVSSILDRSGMDRIIDLKAETM